MITIYHNPKCGKSRDALKLLAASGLEYTVREYLKQPLTIHELRTLNHKLKIAPLMMIRQGEAIFKENYKDKPLSDEDWLEAMVQHPILMERAVVEDENKAIIARPPEKIFEIISKK